MKILISHAHEDSGLAKALANFFERATTRQIRVWFSSDESAAGGMSPGLWYDRLKHELLQTNTIIALVTPNSIDAPWLYFEAGFGAADASKKIVPAYIGLSAELIGMPLSGFQMFNLGGKNGFEAFVAKMFQEAGVEYFPDVHDAPRDRCREDLTAAERNFGTIVATSTESPKLLEMHQLVESLSAKMERNFAELAKQLPGKPSAHFETFDVPIRLISKTGRRLRDFYVQMQTWMSMQDFANETYFKIQDEVGPYEYLTSWVAVDPGTRKKLVIREVASLIPATTLIKAGRRYEVHLLARPYNPQTDSEPEITG